MAGSDGWRHAAWITRAPESAPQLPAPLLRRSFCLDRGKVVRARLYASGLGYGEFFVDGHRIGSRVLDPAPTNYSATVLYSAYDVTDLLTSPIEHVFAAMLGRGRYAEPAWNGWMWDRAPWWDQPKLIARLGVWFADGTVQWVDSDASWRCADGAIRFDSLYMGERHDLRREPLGWTTPGYDDSAWPTAALAAPPTGTLRAQTIEPIEVVDTRRPIALDSPRPGVWVFDLGEQIAGWVKLRMSGPPGAEITVRYGETLDADKTVNLQQTRIEEPIQTDRFVLAGDVQEQLEPRFSYKGFRYAQVEGCVAAPGLDDLTGQVVHTAVADSGEFNCDDDLVNRVHACARRSILNNLHGVPTDTPVFEKNGWSADAHLSAGAAMHNFHMARFYRKWMRDWSDAQLPSGELPPIVPTAGWGYRRPGSTIMAPIPAWDAAYVEIPWECYWHYGDNRALAEHYDNQRRYLDYLINGFLDGGIVYVRLGDWLPPGGHKVPPEGPAVHETAYAHRIVTLLRRIAVVLGRDADAVQYGQLAAEIADAFNTTFLDSTTGAYHGERETEYRQSPNVLALAFGLVPPEMAQRVMDNLVADIHARDDHLNTGVLGTKYLFPVLSDHNLVDLAYRVATRRTYPGYGHWIEQGATALHETWEDDSRSKDHHFFASIDQWFYQCLGGITATQPGFGAVRIAPRCPSPLGRVKAEVDTPYGRVTSHWRRESDTIVLDVEVPAGVLAEVRAPGADVIDWSPDLRHLDGCRYEMLGGSATVTSHAPVQEDRPSN
jgi:alpha-L-rhamnosidase